MFHLPHDCTLSLDVDGTAPPPEPDDLLYYRYT